MKQIKRKQPGYLLFLGSHKKDREQLRVVHGVACTSNQGFMTQPEFHTTSFLLFKQRKAIVIDCVGREVAWTYFSSFILQGTWNQRGDSDGKAELKTDK